MTLPGGQPRGRVLKRFNELGPYLREDKCDAQRFFFDCLAVCVNVKPTPDKREFWGWWLTVDAKETHFTYDYGFGLFDKEGVWQPMAIKNAEDKANVDKTLQAFFPRLSATLLEQGIVLVPAEGTEEIDIDA